MQKLFVLICVCRLYVFFALNKDRKIGMVAKPSTCVQ